MKQTAKPKKESVITLYYNGGEVKLKTRRFTLALEDEAIELLNEMKQSSAQEMKDEFLNSLKFKTGVNPDEAQKLIDKNDSEALFELVDVSESALISFVKAQSKPIDRKVVKHNRIINCKLLQTWIDQDAIEDTQLSEIINEEIGEELSDFWIDQDARLITEQIDIFRRLVSGLQISY